MTLVRWTTKEDKLATEDGMHVLLFSHQMNVQECCKTKTTTKKHTSCSQSVNYERADKYRSVFPLHTTLFPGSSPRHCRSIMQLYGKASRGSTHTSRTPSADFHSVVWWYNTNIIILILMHLTAILYITKPVWRLKAKINSVQKFYWRVWKIAFSLSPL
jgi:hypothetical protein